MGLGAARFVAGPTVEEGLAMLRQLENEGYRTYAIELGEDVVTREDVQRTVDDYAQLLGLLHREGLRSTISIKLSNLGLAFSEDLAYSSARHVLAAADAVGKFVRIDMEGSSLVDPTLSIYRRLRSEGIANVGVVIQAYLHRAQDDLRSLLPLEPNVRLVKGAYLEPATIAHPRKRNVDANYRALIDIALDEASFTAVATHDEKLIEYAKHRAASYGRDAGSEFEYQMLLGVRPALQKSLVEDGYPLRICVPFGAEWFTYLVRRLAERPANLLFGLQSVVRR